MRVAIKRYGILEGHHASYDAKRMNWLQLQDLEQKLFKILQPNSATCYPFLLILLANNKTGWNPGDSLIPGVKTVTNLRGNKAQAAQSETLLRDLIHARHLTICPGHGPISSDL